MKKIVAAYLLLLVDFEIVAIARYFSVFLPIAAACLLVHGFYEMGAETERFEAAVPVVLLSMSARVFFFLMGAFHVLPENESYVLLGGACALGVLLIVSWQFLAGLREIELENDLSFGVWLGGVCCAVFCLEGGLSLVSGTAFVLWMNTSYASPVFALAFFAVIYQLAHAYLRFVERGGSSMRS